MSVPTSGSAHEQHEDPAAHASGKVVQWVSVATMAAEALAQIAANRSRERAAADERAAAAARAEMQARHGQATAVWAPLLDPRTRDSVGLGQTGHIWATAQGWRPAPDAERVTQLAEDRLRTLRPDVMERYDRLRSDGVDPIDAMRRVAPYFDQPAARVWEGQPGPRRAPLEQDVEDVALGAAVAVAATEEQGLPRLAALAGGRPSAGQQSAGEGGESSRSEGTSAAPALPTLSEVAATSNVMHYLQLKDYGMPARDALHASVGSALPWEAYAGYAEARQRGVPAPSAVEALRGQLGAGPRLDAGRADLPEVYTAALHATGSAVPSAADRERAIEATVEHFIAHPTSPTVRHEDFGDLYDRAAEQARVSAGVGGTPLDVPASVEGYREVEGRLRASAAHLLQEQPPAATATLTLPDRSLAAAQQAQSRDLGDLATVRGETAAQHGLTARSQASVLDDPATPRVDEHQVGVARAVPEQTTAASDAGQSRGARAESDRDTVLALDTASKVSPVELAAVAFPEPMNASGAAAARAGATGVAASATSVQQSSAATVAATAHAAATPVPPRRGIRR
ncbi:hypothetical protein EV189_0840 [Motilibacter rhizosphaerae]|uniref:Uncharacterized protein n=1 Tax=Motilibacter rhizosphaerae TaxID=598652 RepID=A0A4Q7NWB3_9ACTN|nr:hypothetical protein [Motilibacter rhizosphaerae]RZS91593.1 hypothetical protein EV189_0840 [Motilibacter rhizosphaerae]